MDSAIKVQTLNGCKWVRERMPYGDQEHPIPCDWLAANARQFHFTAEQVIASSVEPFEDDPSTAHPRICGIYFIMEFDTITYVGLSNNIPRRIAQHRAAGVPIGRIAWFEAPEFFLKDIEEYYIGRIRPMRNTDRGARGDFASLGAKLDAANRQLESQASHD